MESALKADLRALRDFYRSSRDRQRTRTHVEHPQAVSDLTEVLVPVSQSLSAKPQTFIPLASAAEQVTPDPWHEHLCLHRRSSPENRVSPRSSVSQLESEADDLKSEGSGSLDRTRPDPDQVQPVCSTLVLELKRDRKHFPFPNRRSPRISETARRLGLYSS